MAIEQQADMFGGGKEMRLRMFHLRVECARAYCLDRRDEPGPTADELRKGLPAHAENWLDEIEALEIRAAANGGAL